MTTTFTSAFGRQSNGDLVPAAGAEQKAIYPAPVTPLKAEYTIYSGELDNEQAPTRNDRKLAVEVTGQGAKDLRFSVS